jgi:hypothetical protein
MNLFKLTFKEIRHRRLNFLLGIMSVMVAVGCLTAEFTLLHVHDIRTRQILQKKEEETRKKMEILEDDYRKIMKELGFNLLILPADQDLSDLYSEGYAVKTMPEEYVRRLADSGIMTIRHLLPILEQKVQWPEQGNRLIIINGIRGEVPFSHRAPKEPIQIAVPPGTMVVGYLVWSSLNLEKGDTVTLLGEEFTIQECHPQRGSRDDITIWVDLNQAQRLLNMENKINAILALKCHCTGVDIRSIRKEIGEILPDTSVVELSNKALTRAKARDRARTAAENTLKAEEENRRQLRGEIEKFAAWLIPVVVIGCAVWIGLLSFVNVRDRQGELAILSAIGLRSGQIMAIVLLRMGVIGFVGSVAGYGAGLVSGIMAGNMPVDVSTGISVFDPHLLIMSLLGAPLLCVIAGLVPAFIASQKNPADVFSRE